MTDVLATSVGPPTPTPTPAASLPARAAAKTPYRPSAAPVHIGAFTLFACFSLLFASRMAAGEDPALGLRSGALAQPAPPGVLQKVVVTRRISLDGLTRAQIRRRDVDRVIVVRRPVHARATVAAVVAGENGVPTPTIAAATVTTPGATRRAERTSSGTGAAGAPAADPVTGPETSTPVAAPAPAAAAPAAPEPAAAAPPAAPVPAAAPAPVATTTS